MDTAGDLFMVASLLGTCCHLGFADMISSFSRLSSLMPGFFNRTAFANAQNGPIIMCRVVYRRPIQMPDESFRDCFSNKENIYAELSVLPKILDPDKLVRHSGFDQMSARRQQNFINYSTCNF